MVTECKIIVIAFVTLAIISIYEISAKATEEEKKIIYFTGCENAEVVSDIENSIKGVAYYANENNILINKIARKKCGYMLIIGNRKKVLKSALTDADLIDICKKYFHTK